MTFQDVLTIAERFGIPLLELFGILWFSVKYVWPFITETVWPFLVNLVEAARQERIEERDKFLAAISRLVDERDQERDAFIDSLRERDEKLTGARALFLEHLQERDEKFAPVAATLNGLAGLLGELHQLVDERTSSISIHLDAVKKQVDELVEIARRA